MSLLAALCIPHAFAAAIVAHARQDAPREACGLIAGQAGRAARLYPVANVDPSPFRYLMDPHALFEALREIEDHGWDLLAIYHSHTHSAAYPSSTDRRLALYPQSYHLIVSLQGAEPDLRAYHIADGVVESVPVVWVDEATPGPYPSQPSLQHP
jgi:proteasome lid subunit RPN8/RPN11